MEDLNLPIFKDEPQKPKWVTLEQHLKFCLDNIRYIAGVEAYRKMKKPPFVAEKFVIK